MVRASGFCVGCERELSGRRYARCKSCEASRRHRGRVYFRPATARQMSAIEAAWVGGLFEGEGYVSNLKRHTGLSVGSQSVETISTLLRLTGAGRVHYCRDDRHLWYWKVNVRNDILALVPQFLPYTTDRQERLQALAARLEGQAAKPEGEASANRTST